MLNPTVGGPTSPLDDAHAYHHQYHQQQDNENSTPVGMDEHDDIGTEHGDDKPQTTTTTTSSGSNRRRSSGAGRSSTGGRRLSASLANLSLSSGLEATTCLLLPASRIGGVIGRGGDVIKGIRELTGTRIHISSASEDDRDPAFRPVTVSGSVQEVCSAVELIARQAGLFENQQQQQGEGGEEEYYPQGIRMVIDSGNAGQLIGKKGATINEIRTQSQARIQVLSEDESAEEGALGMERVVILMGDAEACRVAHKMICSLLAAAYAAAAGGGGVNSPSGQQQQHVQHVQHVQQHHHHAPVAVGNSSSFFSGGDATPLSDAAFRQHDNAHASSSSFLHGTEHEAGGEGGGEDYDDSCEVIMRVPNDKIGRVIGQGGSVVNQIRADSGCRVDIENTRSGEHALRVIRITGSVAQTQAAQSMIQEKITQEPM